MEQQHSSKKIPFVSNLHTRTNGISLLSFINKVKHIHTDKAWQEKNSQLFGKEWTRSDKKKLSFFAV